MNYLLATLIILNIMTLMFRKNLLHSLLNIATLIAIASVLLLKTLYIEAALVSVILAYSSILFKDTKRDSFNHYKGVALYLPIPLIATSILFLDGTATSSIEKNNLLLPAMISMMSIFIFFIIMYITNKKNKGNRDHE